MGFFQDLKEDLSQAVNELMDEETPIATETVDERNKETSDEGLEELERGDSEVIGLGETYSEGLYQEETDQEQEDAGALEEAQEAMELPEETEDIMFTEENIMKTFDETAETDQDNELDNLLKEVDEKQEESKRMEEKMPEQKYSSESVSDETAIITKGMHIIGNVESKGSMEVIGSIEGNINILGKLNVTGSIKGDSRAEEVFADAAKIVGEITTEGTVKIGASSIIIGNIIATCAVIAGAVKGDIDVQGPVVLDTSAIVMGNIKSKSVQINNGAVIEGLCSQCYAEVNPINFFEDVK